MATRYSGELKIRVTYVEARTAEHAKGACDDHYACDVRHANGRSQVTRDGERSLAWRGLARHARISMAVSYDSSEAYDMIAETALSFALDEGWPVEEHAAMDPDLRRWHVARSYAKRWPEIPADSKLAKAASEAIAEVNARTEESIRCERSYDAGLEASVTNTLPWAKP